MAKRRMGIVTVMLCLCLCLMPCSALAASTADASEPILTSNLCALSIVYRCDGTAFSKQTVKLYKIADVSADFQYTLAPSFAATGLVLNGIQTIGEWNVIRSTLEAHILANDILPMMVNVTDSLGQTGFSQLKPGLYLTSAVRASQGNVTYFFDSALIALPGLDADGLWQYGVTVTPKSEISKPQPSPGPGPSPEPKPEIALKVLKLWKNDDGRNRPQSIEAEIFRDSVSCQIVTLSEENHWSYSWSAKDDGARWTVVERNVPEGYTMTLEERGTTFLLTNTLRPETPPPEEPPAEEPPAEQPPAEEPQPEQPPAGDVPSEEADPEELPPAEGPETGDTPRILLFTVLMYVSGAALILLGITGKRKDV